MDPIYTVACSLTHWATGTGWKLWWKKCILYYINNFRNQNTIYNNNIHEHPLVLNERNIMFSYMEDEPKSPWVHPPRNLNSFIIRLYSMLFCGSRDTFCNYLKSEKHSWILSIPDRYWEQNCKKTVKKVSSLRIEPVDIVHIVNTTPKSMWPPSLHVRSHVEIASASNSRVWLQQS